MCPTILHIAPFKQPELVTNASQINTFQFLPMISVADPRIAKKGVQGSLGSEPPVGVQGAETR